jgi:hypothetical protein
VHSLLSSVGLHTIGSSPINALNKDTMGPLINEREAQYVRTLMKWDERRMRVGWFFMGLMVAGGIIILITTIVSLPQLDDRTALRITLPGLVIGLVCIVASIAGIQWIKRCHLIASIVKKLQHPRDSES